MAQLTAEPEPLARVAAGVAVPPALERVVMRALAKSPADRAPTAQAMADEIEAAVHAS
jgi:hypothetical protein